ncbi:hypothetical protein CN692_18275 [Bacillus sp. AFS002410]|uniref:zf-HC2 domain-containing protein n=1 Tax=Bacillus sp. AFS002410 TaxID=2033481 RepID=UPI000BEF2621|nr:zf-HC2 domain-containing protein [Bacillus sp. AFS002410]PEJ56283.1 hypothetical protein CN692_18275 [Bacillus sp. AFS002410]
MKHLTSDQLLSYQQNKLSKKESLMLEQHLNECSSCEAELELLNELQEEWMNPPDYHFSDDFVNEIMKQTELIEIKDQVNEMKSNNHNSKKVRFIHLVLAAAATFLFFQFQLAERISNSNRQVVQTIDQTSSLIEKSEKITISIPKILKENKK